MISGEGDLESWSIELAIAYLNMTLVNMLVCLLCMLLVSILNLFPVASTAISLCLYIMCVVSLCLYHGFCSDDIKHLFNLSHYW